MVEKDNIARTISTNAIYSALFNVWYLGSRLILAPLILSYIEVDEYGLWSYCFIVLSYLSLTAFGFNTTYIRYAADYRSRNENEKLNQLLSTGILTMLALTVVIFPLFVWVAPNLMGILGIDVRLRQTAQGLMVGTAAIFFMNFCLAGYQSILEGEQRIALVRKIHFVASVIEIGLIVILFEAGLGVFALLWAYAARFGLVVVGCIFFAYRVFPFLRLRISLYRKEALKKFLGYGNQMNLLGFLSLVINSADRILITRIMQLEAVGIYEIGRKLPNIGLMLPSSIAGTLMPAASHLMGSSQYDRLQKIYISSTRYLMLLSSLPYAFLMFFSNEIITVWVGPDYPQAALVMQVLALGTFTNLFTGIGTSCVRGMGKPRYEIEYMALSAVLILGLTPILIPKFGLLGAASAYCVGQVFGSIYFLWRTNAVFGLSGFQFVRRVCPLVFVILLAGIPSIGLCRWLWPLQLSSRWLGILILCLVGMAYVLSVMAILFIFKHQLLEEEEIQRLMSIPLPQPVSPVWRWMWCPK
ncbi:MAG: flippase [Desulfobacteraceae bacterium]|jgi:O-antigen/teichoic acid export membrane protein